jgi:hypothetical protein
MINGMTLHENSIARRSSTLNNSNIITSSEKEEIKIDTTALYMDSNDYSVKSPSVTVDGPTESS